MYKYIWQNLLLLLLLNCNSAFNYLFQVVVGKALPAEDFGTFNALNSIAVLIAVPLSVLPLVVARYTAELSLSGLTVVRTLLRRSFRYLGLAAAAVFLAGLLFLNLISDFLHMHTTIPVMIMLAQMSLSVLLPVNTGVLQGLQRFLGYGLSSTVLTVGRLVCGIVLVTFLGLGVNGALWAGVFGVALAIVLSILFLKDLFRGPVAPLPNGMGVNMLRYSVPVCLVTIFVLALGNLDIILVRHFCPPEEAGLYASAAILGRIAFFAPGILASILFPRIVKAKAEDTGGARCLWETLGLTALLAGGFACICEFWGREVISLFFNTTYVGAAPLLGIVSTSMALLALGQVIFTYGLARASYGFIWVLFVGVMGMLLAVTLYHDSPLHIAYALLGTTCFILIGVFFWLLGEIGRQKQHIELPNDVPEDRPLCHRLNPIADIDSGR